MWTAIADELIGKVPRLDAVERAALLEIVKRALAKENADVQANAKHLDVIDLEVSGRVGLAHRRTAAHDPRTGTR